ncbi:MAG TPA: hypothetical protein VHT03_07535 [Rhizomicrobium sp.]|jgi:hypothetical protein|nr:hypothetical protein [Rhizomicrobium sp.]
MKRLTGLIVGAIALSLLSAVPTAAGLSGDYAITFLSGPQRQNIMGGCVTFTNTGGILGFPDSGTWVLNIYPDWSGNFVVDRTRLRWYGTYNGGTVMTNLYNRIENDVPGNGGFDQWQASTPPTALYDGITKMRPGCTPFRHKSR